MIKAMWCWQTDRGAGPAADWRSNVIAVQKKLPLQQCWSNQTFIGQKKKSNCNKKDHSQTLTLHTKHRVNKQRKTKPNQTNKNLKVDFGI